MSHLLELSLLGSLLALCVLALRGLGGRWLSAGLFTFAWLLVGLRLLVPVTPDSPLSLLNLRPAVEQLLADKEAESALRNVPVVEDRVSLGSLPGFASKPESPPPVRRPAPLEVFGLVWLAGFLGLVGLAIFGQWRFSRRLLSGEDEPSGADVSKPAPPARLAKLLEEAAEAVGLKRPLPLKFSRQITSPCLCGIFRPVIVLPVGLAASLSDPELRLIFQHEMTHARRRDHWLHGILGLAAACHWFNPLAWWARRACRQDCELATDASLVERATSSDRHTYGELLLKIALLNPRPHSHLHLHFASLPMASPGKKKLQHRIIMLKQTNKKHPLVRYAGLLLLSLAVVITGTGAMEPQEANTTILLQAQETGQPVVKARQVSLVAKDVRVLLFEQPVQEGAAALRTLASQVFQAEAPREFQIGWEIAGDQLVLKTDASEGTMYSLPENFVLDQKQRNASHYPIGHFQRDGFQWILLIEIKAKAEKERITKRIVRPTRAEELKRMRRMESKPPSPQWVPASPFKDATTPAADSDSISQTLEIEMTDVKDATTKAEDPGGVNSGGRE